MEKPKRRKYNLPTFRDPKDYPTKNEKEDEKMEISELSEKDLFELANKGDELASMELFDRGIIGALEMYRLNEGENSEITEYERLVYGYGPLEDDYSEESCA